MESVPSLNQMMARKFNVSEAANHVKLLIPAKNVKMDIILVGMFALVVTQAAKHVTEQHQQIAKVAIKSLSLKMDNVPHVQILIVYPAP